MTKELFFRAIVFFAVGFVIVAALLFLPAWTICYPQAWLLLGILFVPMFAAGLVMMVKNPELLKKRLNAKEKEGEQRTVIALSGIMFLAAFVAAALSFRFDFLMLPSRSASLPRSYFLALMHFMRKCSGRTPIFPGPLRSRRTRK